MKRLLVLLLLLALIYLGTGLFFVQPDEQAVIQRFGAVVGLPRQPGAQWGLPWGMDRVYRIKTNEVKRLTIGPAELGEAAVGNAVAQYLTADRNLVNVRATVQYSIAQPARFLFQTGELESLIASTAEASLSETLAGHSVDWALTSGKRDAGVLLVEHLQRRLDRYGIGVTVRSVDLAAVEPPAEVADAFDDVISAARQRERMIHQAHSFADQTVAQARADAQRLVDEARGERDRLVRGAQGEAARFESLLVEYQRAAELTSQRLYLETMSYVLPRFRAKLFVDGASQVDLSILREEKP